MTIDVVGVNVQLVAGTGGGAHPARSRAASITSRTVEILEVRCHPMV
jgi:hypothetical protein